ncbi:hypothetical protein SVAN01_08207 [Stagonosporopsis vannaccii]|nr:hypothetical protein SVAN01_08207 [Stagonosporopsis vannaccii]
MSRLLELSTEIILCVASVLEQADLMNISLTCKHLKDATKPELYRVYSNPHLHGRLIAKFVIHLARYPEIAKHVKEIDIKGWQALAELLPEHYEANYMLTRYRSTREEKAETFDRFRRPEPTEDEYSLLVAAAMATGVIKEALLYGDESTIIKRVRPMLSTDIPDGSPWYANILGDDCTWDNVPYDRKFCELLRSGTDDPYAVLLLAFLPHLSHIFLRGARAEPTSLGLPSPLHAYKALRTLKIGCMDAQDAWGIDYLNGMLMHAPLEELYLHNASSWCQQGQDTYNDDKAATLRLQPASLRLTKLEMVNCALTKSDMQMLLNATTSLRSLLYWTGDDDTGPDNFLSQELIDMLEPFKNTLEELYLEIEHLWGDSEFVGRIKTLSHFTALKILDTTVEMWECLLDGDGEHARIDAEQLFCYRLPRNLKKLVLHPLKHHNREFGPDVPAPLQIESLDSKCAELLQDLQEVYIGSTDADDARALDNALECRLRHRPNLRIVVDTSGTGGGPTRSFFHDVLISRRSPVTKWDGEKYSVHIT